MIRIVAACSANRVIGRGGALPWSLPGDLRHFRDLTVGHTVVMGRRTWDSLPDAVRPLPKRRNLVLTSTPESLPEGIEAFTSLTAALDACDLDCFVIGGERVFRDALPIAGQVHLTRVDGDVEGDAFLPELGERWTLVEESEPVVEDGHRYVFQVWE